MGFKGFWLDFCLWIRLGLMREDVVFMMVIMVIVYGKVWCSENWFVVGYFFKECCFVVCIFSFFEF